MHHNFFNDYSINLEYNLYLLKLRLSIFLYERWTTWLRIVLRDRSQIYWFGVMARNGKMFSVKEALIDTQHATFHQHMEKVRHNQALLLVET